MYHSAVESQKKMSLQLKELGEVGGGGVVGGVKEQGGCNIAGHGGGCSGGAWWGL